MGKTGQIYAFGGGSRVPLRNAALAKAELVIDGIERAKAALEGLERRAHLNRAMLETTGSMGDVASLFGDSLDQAVLELMRRVDHFEALIWVGYANEEVA